MIAWAFSPGAGIAVPSHCMLFMLNKTYLGSLTTLRLTSLVLRHKFLQIDVYPQSLGCHRVEDRPKLELIHDIDERRVCLEGQVLRPWTMSQAAEEDFLSPVPELFPRIAELDVASPEFWV